MKRHGFQNLSILSPLFIDTSQFQGDSNFYPILSVPVVS